MYIHNKPEQKEGTLVDLGRVEGEKTQRSEIGSESVKHFRLYGTFGEMKFSD